MTDGPVRLLDVFIPPAPRSADELLKLRLAVAMSILAACACVLFLVINVVKAHEGMVWIYLTGSVATVGSLLLYRLTGRAAAVIHSYALISSVMLVLSCIQFGKADVGTLIYFAVIPLGLLFVGGLRAGIAWLVIGVTISLVMFALDVTGRLPVAEADNSKISDLANVLAVIGLAFLFAALFHNLTARANRDLDAANRELADARVRAELASKAKSEFLATMTHELRTPMNGVIGITHMLLDGPLDPTQRELGGSLKRSGEALLELIDDILDFEKIEAGRLDLEETDLDPRALTRAVVDLVAFRAHEKGLALDVVADPKVAPLVRADAARLRQVLLNLVGNAIKFTERGRVTVHVRMRDGRLLFDVEDTGIGIPPEHRPKLFQPFSQGDSSMARRYGGTGLGLAISRRIVEAMGGEIEFASEAGRGSTFSFSVPVRAPLGADPDARRAGRPDLALSLHALVVEDNPVNAQVTVHLLRTRGLTCEVATDGNAALERLAHGRFDVVFMDCQMPSLDGFEATKRWRAAERTVRTPIIAMTAATQASDRDAAVRAGMDDFLTKPVTAEELDRVLGRIAPSASV